MRHLAGIFDTKFTKKIIYGQKTVEKIEIFIT